MNYPNCVWEERIHIFRPEFPGKYLHYSRPFDDKFGFHEKVEEARYYTLSEVDAWISSHDAGPIGEDEIDRLKRGIMVSPDDLDAKRGIFRSTETAEEPKYIAPEKPQKPESTESKNGPGANETLMTQCPSCGAWVWPRFLPVHMLNYHGAED